MIRRTAGDRFYLISQDDHAKLAGELAGHWGNDRFSKPNPAELTILGATLHDCGWPLHDLAPTLNKDGLPLDVFETPREIALRVWAASVNQSAEHGDYVQLLVSLHVLFLSVQLTMTDPIDRFEINKFQHQQVELQENLRRQLGMRSTMPLKLGLEVEPSNQQEQWLRLNFHLLQALDLISLALCCTRPPFSHSRLVWDQPDGTPTPLTMNRVDERTVRVSPWPFDRPQIELEIPCRAVRAVRFDNVESFQREFAAASICKLSQQLIA
jgi:hypothetical protein